MKVFVINAYPYRAKKYDKRYTLFKPRPYKTIPDKLLEGQHFMWNAKKDYRQKVVSNLMANISLLNKIIKDDLKNVIIMEDDFVLDFNRFKELKGQKGFVYLGGEILSPLMKDFEKFRKKKKEFIRKNIKRGINQIDPKKFRIGETAAYFIPNKQVAQEIKDNLFQGEKRHAIDTEFVRLQKEGVINFFVFPAIATSILEEANKGYTASQYKKEHDQYYY